MFSSSLLGAEEQLLQRVDVCHLLEQRVPPSVVSLRWRGHAAAAAAAAVTGLLLVLAESCDLCWPPIGHCYMCSDVAGVTR